MPCPTEYKIYSLCLWFYNGQGVNGVFFRAHVGYDNAFSHISAKKGLPLSLRIDSRINKLTGEPSGTALSRLRMRLVRIPSDAPSVPAGASFLFLRNG